MDKTAKTLKKSVQTITIVTLNKEGQNHIKNITEI